MKLHKSFILLFSFFVLAPSWAGLVAKWDFNNYDPANPTSAAILAPTVGDLAAIPCTGTSDSTEVTDGTLGSITVVNTGLPSGDYALSIPKGAHLKIPLPSGIVRGKSWTLRIRFNYPGTAKTFNTLVSGQYDGVGNELWHISDQDLVQGNEGMFGTSAEENINSTGKSGVQNNNGWNAFRLVSRDAWHSFTAHFGPDGAASTLDGYRGVAMLNTTDIRTNFTGDGFVLCAGDSSATTYVSSVEVWEDTPIYRDANGGTCISASSRKVFSGCSLEGLRDMYISVRGTGTWGDYARTMSSWEHIVTTDGEGNATGLKIDLRNKNGDGTILCDFAPSGSDVVGNSLRMQYGIGWSNPYFTTDGGFVSSVNAREAPDAWNGVGYAPYNVYALPFRPLDGDLVWSMQMGTGKFGNPIFSIVGSNPTLTFDAAPQADSITLDCGRGDGQAGVRFAYGLDALKTMSGVGSLNITDGVTLTVPPGVSIAGALTFTAAAKMAIDIAGLSLSEGDVLFAAVGGIALPTGKAIADLVYVPVGSVELSQDGTQLLLAPDPSIVVTAVWTGLGDRSNVSDPLNWTCYNYAGTVLQGEIPGEKTSITVSGATTFNVPAGQAITCHSLSIQSCTLSADCDWRGLGVAVPLASGAAVDLDGHKLTVAGLESGVAATIRNDNAGTLSELHVNATADTSNTQVAIAGNVKVVKEGDGAFLAGKGQAYTGGSEILGGAVRASLNATQQATMGAGGNEIVVRNDATLQLEGEVWYSVYRIVLDGGTVLSTFAGANGAIFGNTRLLSDSAFRTDGSGKLHLWLGNTVDLGGKTLEVALSDAGTFMVGMKNADAAAVTTFTNGTMSVSGGTFQICSGYKGTVEARTVRLRMNSAMDIPGACAFNVGDYEALYDGTGDAGSGTVKVFGTFKPSAHDRFYGATMQDGSTIDLSLRTSALPLVSSSAGGDKTLKFADGATVYVRLGDFNAPSGTRVISWGQPPANIGTVMIVSADIGRSFVPLDDGLYVRRGFMLLVR